MRYICVYFGENLGRRKMSSILGKLTGWFSNKNSKSIVPDDELNSCSKIKPNDAINSSMWDETNIVGSKVVPSNHDKMTSLTGPKVVTDSGFEDEQISPHVTFATNDDSIRVNALTDNTPPRVSPSPATSTPGLNTSAPIPSMGPADMYHMFNGLNHRSSPDR